MKNKPSYQQWFIYFALYNLLFLTLQFGFIFQRSASFINAIPLPSHVYLWLGMTIFTHIALYLLLSALQTTLIWGLTQRRLTLASLERWHTLIWSFSICAILTTNIYFFPLSRFSRLFLPEVPLSFVVILMLFSLFILSLLLLNTLFFASRQYPKGFGIVSLLFLIAFIYQPTKISGDLNRNSSSPTHPNIIFIGIDSLSPSRINSKDTPTLVNFIKNGVFYKETISPLGHTFPAWSSILTGLYPQHHQAHYNLTPLNMVERSKSIAWTLQRSGYQTIFATDDRQFNNMGEEFGFQKIIGPPVGANDMLIGTFNDFPLGNLLINLPIGRWIFPYNYINRASHFSYYPQTFDKELRHSLAGFAKPPYFIAVHFTLPHWPYAWANSSFVQISFENSDIKKQGQLYLEALQQVDQQVHHLLHTLKDYGYLDNSMVVLLSDHGETLYDQGSRQTNLRTYQGSHSSLFADYIKRKTSTGLEMSMGHGSDLLSSDQYHCLLAFQIFQHQHLITAPQIMTTRIALIDLAPTVYAFLGITKPAAMDGISLLPSIQHNAKLPARAFVMESGMLPNQFISQERAQALGQEFFTIDPRSNKLQLQKDKISILDREKLYALIEKDWILALYPDDTGYVPIIFNLNDGTWTDEWSADFARKSPAESMLKQLEEFYHKKIALRAMKYE